MSRVNVPPGQWTHYEPWAPEPKGAQPNPQVNVTDPPTDRVLYGPRGEVIARVSDRNPIGFR